MFGVVPAEIDCWITKQNRNGEKLCNQWFTISLSDANDHSFVWIHATFTFTLLLSMIVHYQQMTICFFFHLKLVCRAWLYAVWGFGSHMWGRRGDTEETDSEGKGWLREKIGGRQGCWLVQRFSFTTCYAFCPCETVPFGVWTHHPQCLVSLIPPVTPYVRSASILHKG